MEKYRSGHNENDSKSFDRLIAGPWVRIPPSPPEALESENSQEPFSISANSFSGVAASSPAMQLAGSSMAAVLR